MAAGARRASSSPASTAVFVFLKFVFNIHFSDFGFGFWLGVILTAGLVYVTLQARHSNVGVASA